MEERQSPFLASGRAYLCLAAIWAVSMAATLYWLHIDQAPLGWDQMERLVQSVSIYRTLSHPTTDFLAQIAAAHAFYPPFQPLAAVAGYALFGVSADVGVAASSGFFLAILLLSTYDLGCTLRDSRTGVLAAFIVATYPSVFGGRNGFDVDLALTALVALFMALLVRSDGFRQRKWAVLVGIAAGCALLTKWTFPAFVGGPALYLWLRALRNSGDRRRVVVNASIALGLCLLIAAAWWGYKLDYVLTEFVPSAAGTGPNEGDPGLFVEPFWALVYYLHGLNLQLSFFYCVLLAVALPVFYFAKQVAGCQKVMLALWMVLPYAALTAIANKEPRYYEPAYPAMALITAAALWRMLGGARWRPLRVAVMAALIAFAVFQFYSISFGFGWIKANGYVPRVPNEGQYTNRQFKLYLYSQSYGCAPHADPDDWQADAIQSLVDGYALKETGLKIVVFSEQPELRYPLVFHSFVEQLDYTVQSVGLNKFKEKDYTTADFVLFHTPPQTLTYRTDSPKIAERISDGTGHFEELNAERGEFQWVADLDLLDGSQVSVFRRKVRSPED